MKGDLLFAILSKYWKVEKEYKFHADRGYRADYCIPSARIIIEHEGGTFIGGRHVRGTGYAKDCKKYNLATVNGWRVLRYPTINPGQIIEDIKALIENDLSKGIKYIEVLHDCSCNRSL